MVALAAVQPEVAATSPAAEAPAVEGAYSGLLDSLRRSPKQLPCSYLYDAAGSELYERITELKEYYPFRTEQAMLRQHVKDVVSYITPGSVVVELGCGSAQKTSILLNELLARDGSEQVRFAGIDCSGAALEMAKSALLSSCEGLAPCNINLVCEEYTQGVKECRDRFPNEQLVVLWLGSSVGNLKTPEAVQFFRDMTAGGSDHIQVLLCADMWKDRDVLHAAYCDREGVTEAFIKNGLRHAFGSLGCAAAADPAKWDYEVDINAENTQVEMWLRAKTHIGRVADGVSIAAGERVLVEVSRKFTPQKLAGMAYKSGLYIQAAWRTDMYSMQLLVSPMEALRRCWADANAFFDRILDWGAHPIAVRHPFCFYYGHVAAFAKLKVLPHLPASGMDTMMSRGIDPDVADPQRCHSHPGVPDKWPSRAELRAYVAATRAAILQHGGLQDAGTDAEVMRRVCLAVEHDRMHLETLLYMAVQQVKADFLAGPIRPATPRGSQSEKVQRAGTAAKGAACYGVQIPGGTMQLGAPTDGSIGFVWDNEGPQQPPQQVAPFHVAAAPVTIGEFYDFAVTERGYERPEFWAPDDYALFAGKGQVLPATWSQANEGASVFVHWPNGSTCGWRDVSDEPVLCSLAEAEAYCRFHGAGARIMSEPEYERLLAPDVAGRVRHLRQGGWEWTATPFEPLPGFTAMPEYPEYSTDFFDGRHYVLRGASAVTHPAVRRDSFRNFYQRQYPYVFAKFRLCFGDDAAETAASDNHSRIR